MRSIVFLCLSLTASTLFGQFDFSSGPVKPTVSELQAKVAQLEAENRELRAQLRAMPAKEPTPAAKIVMESIDNCEACRISDARDSVRYRAAGWLWETVKVRAMPGRTYPRYRVCIGDVCEIVEIRNLSELDGKIQSLLERRAR